MGIVKSLLKTLAQEKPKRKLPTASGKDISLDEIELTDQLKEILDLLENSRESIFITGRAGTGKSTLLKYFRAHAKKKVAVLAFTGVAAVNVRGQTIHSFFGFKPGITEKRVQKREDEENELYKHLDTIIIDEVSMLRSDLLDCIEKFLRLNGPHPKEPFGGVQMVFIGDLYQLPPIVEEEEKDIFKSHYKSEFFFDSRTYHKIPFKTFHLKKVYRQKESNFVDILDAIRISEISTHHLEEINQRCENLSEEVHGSHVYLTTTNEGARIVNTKRLARLPGKQWSLTGYIIGNFGVGKKSLPTDEILQVKEGAQIMLLNNDADKRWVNGDLAFIEEIKKESEGISIWIKLANGSIEQLLPYTWEKIRYFYNKEEKELDSETTGEFTQYPFRLAWALTIHKGQGKTFDKVIVDFGRGTFAHGQAYVALSRCTTLEGLALRVPLEDRHIIVDRRVNEFMENAESDTGLPIS